MQIRIVFVVMSLGVGGAETQVIQLAKTLGPGFSPFIVCTKGEGEQAGRARADGITVVSLDLRSGRDPRTLTRLVSLLRTIRPSIVHCTNFDSTAWGRAAAILSGVPCIVTAEHATHHTGARRLAHIVSPRANRVFASRTDRIVACGYNQVPTLVAAGNRRDRIRVIVNGVDPEQFSSELDPIARREFGIPDGAVAVGIIARLSPEKNHQMFIRAVSMLETAPELTHFVVVGDGPCREELEQLVCDAGLGPHVTFLGTRTDVPRVLTALDVVALTSFAGRDTFPLSILEAMAAGRPMVVTDFGDVRRIVVDGETGYVVPSGDVRAFANRLDRLIADPKLRSEMGRSARQRVVEMYPRDLMTRSYEQLFDEVLAEHGIARGAISDNE